MYISDRNQNSTLKGHLEFVTNLDAGDKTTLLTLYNNAILEPKRKWMMRMPVNVEGDLLADAGNINSDGTLTTHEKEMLGEIICQKYPIKHTVRVILPKIPFE